LGSQTLEAPSNADRDPAGSQNRAVYPMSLRRQLPVYSPLSASALLSGAGALLGGGAAARRRVIDWLESGWRTTDPLLTDSGTTALTLAMLATQSPSRQGVALPAYGCYDLVTAALGAGIPVRWYDLDPATLGPDWPSLETAAQGVDAIVVVHYYGVPVDIAPVRDLARRRGLLIIEDAAQGIGGTLEQLPLGALGDLGVLSFGRGKGLTGGGGGALLINTPAGRKSFAVLDQSLPSPKGGLRLLLTTAVQWLLARPAVYALPSAIPVLKLGETVFRQPEPPQDIDRISLGILAATLSQVAPEAETRRRNAEWIKSRLPVGARSPSGKSGTGGSGYLRLPVLLPRRKSSLDEWGRQLGVMPGYPRVLNALPGVTASSERFAGSQELVQSLVTAPVHSKLSRNDREKIVNWFQAAAAESANSS
jgi:perosamine synthetase